MLFVCVFEQREIDINMIQGALSVWLIKRFPALDRAWLYYFFGLSEFINQNFIIIMIFAMFSR